MKAEAWAAKHIINPPMLPPNAPWLETESREWTFCPAHATSMDCKKFFRLPRDADRAGAGPGFSIVREIVDANLGKIAFCP
jgi:hypothetical protein